MKKALVPHSLVNRSTNAAIVLIECELERLLDTAPDAPRWQRNRDRALPYDCNRENLNPGFVQIRVGSDEFRMPYYETLEVLKGLRFSQDMPFSDRLEVLQKRLSEASR